MVSLLKVKHEVLVFGQTASKWNNYGLQGITVLSTESMARKWSLQLKLRFPDRSTVIRKAL